MVRPVMDYTHPDGARHDTYSELYSGVYRDLFPATRTYLERLTALTLRQERNDGA